MGSASVALHLPWNGHPGYWLCAVVESPQTPFNQRLEDAGMVRIDASQPTFIMQTPANWEPAWENLYDIIHAAGDTDWVKLALIPGGEQPDPEMIYSNLLPVSTMERIARNIWLGKVLTENGLQVYFQTVVDKKRKIIGHEALARIESAEGDVITGYQIIGASKALNIEHVVDRYLQSHAIRQFREGKLKGKLFLNFIPGFIHRPEVYLQGLEEQIEEKRIKPEQLVLDITGCDVKQDLRHLRDIIAFCRTRGYLVALDDIQSLDNGRMLINELAPDYVKLDRILCHDIIEDGRYEELRQLCYFAKRASCRVIAEAVENEQMFSALVRGDVDLFQGYLFSHPAPITTAS